MNAFRVVIGALCAVLLFALVIAPSSGCSRTKQNADATRSESKRDPAQIDPVVVLDDWWNVDYVKNGCEMYAKQGSPCPATPSAEELVRAFDNSLKVAFASEATCHGLSLLTFTPDMANAAVKNPSAPATGKAKTMAESQHWSLMFDLDGRQENQNGRGWTLVGPSQQAFNGEIKTTQGVAQDVCKIVNGVGGSTD